MVPNSKRLLGALVLGAFLLGSPAAASADIPGEILFENEAGGIWTIEPDGSDESQIRATGYGPRFSPDATRIAFVDDRGTGEAIYAMNSAGTAPAPLIPASDGFYTGAIAWSPDGAKIVFARDDTLWSVSSAGGAVTELSDPDDDLHDLPLFSNDGTKIAFQDQDDFSLGVMSSTGAATNNDLTSPTIDQVDVPNDVAEDGRILYTRVDDSGASTTAELRMIGFDGGGDVSLGVAPSVDEAAGYRFSPDGSELVWDDEGETDELRTGAPATAGIALPVTPFPAYPDWAADDGITVNDKGDDDDADDADDVCDSDDATAGKQCTLRAAIETANAKAGPDEIDFEIPFSDGRTITPGSALPPVTSKVTIDGTTQPNTLEDEPGIYLDGTSAGNAHGIQLGEGSGDSTVRGFNIHGFQKTGIVAGGDGGHTLEANWIGFEVASGAYDQSSIDGNGSGIDVRSADVTIGGNTPAQRNIVSANGNPDGVTAYLDSLDGSDVSQAAIHDIFANLGIGILISDGEASDVTITGNWIGPDPSGERFGDETGITSTFGVFVGPEAGISTDIAIGGPTASPGTAAGNVISGNFMGVLAAPDPATAGVVSGLDIKGNLIGADPNGSAGSAVGGLFGVFVLNQVSGLQIGGAGTAANKIQGQIAGVASAGSTLRIQNNLIGVEEDLDDFSGGFDEQSSTPGIGLHNIFGVLLADNTGSLIGGSAPQLGNKIVGNLIGAAVSGENSARNAILNNTIGLSAAPPASVDLDELDGGELGSFIGLLLDGSGNDIGDPGAGNLIQANALGVIEDGAEGGHVQANDFNGNVFGYLGTQIADRRFGGEPKAQANTFTGNVIGLTMAGWAPTEEELEAAHVGDGNPVRAEDRELAFDAEASQGPLNLLEATSSYPDADQAVALGDPPGPSGPALRAAKAQRRAPSSGSDIIGNSFGVDRTGGEGANAIGAFLAGTHSNYEVAGNTIAHNYGGGLFIGNAVRLGSGVPEPKNIRLVSNRIWDNFSPGRNLPGVAALGMDLLEPKPKELATESAGVTENDPGDADAGANGRQNYPVIESAARQPNGSVVIEGNLPSKASQAYKVELFANQRCNAFGGGEGEVPIGSGPFNVTTNGSGRGSFSQTVQLPAGAGAKITANATGPEGTSEFSPCATIGTEPPDKTAPDGEASGKGNNKAGTPTTITATSSEDGIVQASGTQNGSEGRSKKSASAARIAVTFGKKKGKGKKKPKSYKLNLAPVRKAVKADQTVTLKLKPRSKKDKKAAKKLKKAVKKGGKAKAKLKVTFTDEAGNRAVEKLNLKLK